MIDTTTSIAFAIWSHPGLYALLLGSGLSTAAGIPTGHGITLDLARKVALLNGADCAGDPAGWYESTYGEEPDYSKLLARLAHSQAERAGLLRRYIEPTDDERAHDLKVATAAHKAIAQLVANGSIRVIVTTNFDRLLETTIAELGPPPVVISTTDSARGALPLVHNRCTVLKVNGDYLDARIRNIEAELSQYPRPIALLLDQIFDEYGLIICGWSTRYDRALRAALERCRNHRFTTFWSFHEQLDEDAKALIALRKAQTIGPCSADQLFVSVAEKVSALQASSPPHPLDVVVARAMVKRYIARPEFTPLLHDLLFQETERAYGVLEGDEFSAQVLGDDDALRHRIARYEAVLCVLVNMYVTGCYWGAAQHTAIWSKCLERVACLTRQKSGHLIWLALRGYPALLLLYAGGIAAIANEQYGTLRTLMETEVIDSDRSSKGPVATWLYPDAVLGKDDAVQVLAPAPRLAPLSGHMQQLLSEPFSNVIAEPLRYERHFDRFEYMLSLIGTDLRSQLQLDGIMPPGAFLQRRTVIADVQSELDKTGQHWPPLKASLFGGSLDRLQAAKQRVDDLVKHYTILPCTR